ncbi:unnamed protein product [Protopolystoma xenopodis]|uniref:Uncharacterized protein n=1 Tax=Protopolystoma xenopodis TaxID=117903 RepID=A0A448WGC6_9PLAT|nr:unnamed protein product [Protopolystoma xenopodis]
MLKAFSFFSQSRCFYRRSTMELQGRENPKSSYSTIFPRDKRKSSTFSLTNLAPFILDTLRPTLPQASNMSSQFFSPCNTTSPNSIGPASTSDSTKGPRDAKEWLDTAVHYSINVCAGRNEADKSLGRFMECAKGIKTALHSIHLSFTVSQNLVRKLLVIIESRLGEISRDMHLSNGLLPYYGSQVQSKILMDKLWFLSEIMKVLRQKLLVTHALGDLVGKLPKELDRAIVDVENSDFS